MTDLGLEQVKDLEIGRPEKKVLSGGQRKRVNIALELVTDPALLFLDEPTSGLAADDTVALIDLLAGLARKQGKTIIVTIHQPAREEYEKFNLALIMGFGGEPIYFGPTGPDSYRFFGRYLGAVGDNIDNPRDMFDVLKRREDDVAKVARGTSRAEVRQRAVKAWRAEFFSKENPVFQRMYSGDRKPGAPTEAQIPPKRPAPLLSQLSLLLSRYGVMKTRDRMGALILFLQAPLIGLLLTVVYSGPTKHAPPWCQSEVLRLESDATCLYQGASHFPNVADYTGALFFLVIAAMWFGTSNAAREIVAERAEDLAS